MAPACVAGLTTPLLSKPLDGQFATLAWLVDLASHWQWLYLIGLLLSVLLLASSNRRQAGWLIALPLFWVNASEPAPRWDVPPGGPVNSLSVVTANVHLENTDTTPLIRWLEQAQPDVVVLLEVSTGYASQLEKLQTYPFRHVVPRPNPFGLAVLSRFPLDHVQTRADNEGIEHIDAVIQWNGQTVKLTAWHPMPPIAEVFHAQRNRQLRALANEAQASGLPAIVAGDLNATPWSVAFNQLNHAGLRRASGLAPTWPVAGQGWLGIPIDHVLVSPHWVVLQHGRGPDLGSDHLPVWVKIGLRS